MDLKQPAGPGNHHRPGAPRQPARTATDVFLGYEQALLQFRYGPEKFAAKNTATHNNVTSLGAETYYYTVGGTNQVNSRQRQRNRHRTSTPTFVYHDPAAPATPIGGGPATQMNPTNPAPSQPVDLWVKVGYNYRTNHCYIYFTSDGTNPEGAFGVGKATTQVVLASYMMNDVSDSTINWFKGTIPAATRSMTCRCATKSPCSRRTSHPSPMRTTQSSTV